MELLKNAGLFLQTDPLWAYLTLALLVAIEGPIITLFGAGAASAGLLNPLGVFLSASAGNLLADTIWYGLGYIGKVEWLGRFASRFGISQKNLDQLSHGMSDHAVRVIFIAKLTMSLVIPALVTAGLIKIPWRKWFLPLCLAEIIWTGTLVLVGYYATQTIMQVKQGLELVLPILSLIILAGLFFWGRSKRTILSEDKESR